MSIRVMTAVWDTRGIQTSAYRLVLLKLADCANDAGEQSYPSVKTVAKDTELSERQVQRALRWLEQAGFIEPTSPATQRKPTTWKLTLGRHPVAPGVTSCPVRGDISDTPGVTSVSPDPSRDPSIDPSRDDLARFEEFWAVYPKHRRTGKGAARKIWLRLKPGVDRTRQIVEAVHRQSQSRQWRSGYIPLPITWLNQERWEDDPESGNGPSGGQGGSVSEIRQANSAHVLKTTAPPNIIHG